MEFCPTGYIRRDLCSGKLRWNISTSLMLFLSNISFYTMSLFISSVMSISINVGNELHSCLLHDIVDTTQMCTSLAVRLSGLLHSSVKQWYLLRSTNDFYSFLLPKWCGEEGIAVVKYRLQLPIIVEHNSLSMILAHVWFARKVVRTLYI